MLAEIDARLGQKEDAIREGEHALALRPIAKDAVDAPAITTRLAAVYAQVGEIDRAFQILESVINQPNATNYGALLLDECWDPLRKDPRFQRIVATLAPASDSL